MRRRLAVALLALAAAGCHEPSHTATPPPPPSRHLVLVGDSLTMQFAGPFRSLSPDRVTATYWPGTNPVRVDWAGWVRAAGPADVVVMQDYTGECCDMGGYTAEEYDAAVAEVRYIASDMGARFVVLGVDLPMAPADDPDGVHYRPAGAQAEARLLLSQLRTLTA